MKSLKYVTLLVGIIMILSVTISFVSSNKVTTYTPTTTTVCDGGTCSKILYSGIKNVYLDNHWIDIDKAKSLKDSGIYTPNFLEIDEDYPLEIIDYNMTSITVKLKQWSFFNEEVDLRIWEYSEEKDKQYRQDIKDGKKEKSGLESSYKDIFDKVLHKKEVFNAFSLGSRTITYNVKPGDIIEFGPNSTVVVLQDADTENLEDSMINEGNADYVYGDLTSCWIGNYTGDSRELMIKFNISSVTGLDIIKANLTFDVYQNDLSAGESFDVRPYHVYQSYAWDETTITWNNRPNISSQMNLSSDSSTTGVGANNGTISFDILNMMNRASGAGDSNLSILLKVYDGVNIEDTDQISVYMKEETNTSAIPKLEITWIYSAPNVTISYPIDDTIYNTAVNHFNWTVANVTTLEDCKYSLNGAANQTVNCSDTYEALSLADNAYTLIFSLNDSNGEANWTHVNFTQDITTPVINVTYPYETITNETVGHTLYFNWTSTDATTNLSSCWYNYNNTNTTVTCTDLNTTFVTNIAGDRSITFYVNDSANNIANFTRSWDYKFLERERTFNASSYETNTDTYILNMSSDGTQVVTAEFWYNNTLYDATKVGNNVEMTFTSEVSHPFGEPGNHTFYWTVLHSTTILNTTSAGQDVQGLYFGPCNASLTTPFINFTFKDEITDTFTNSTFDVIDWYYYLGDGTQNKSFSYSNATEQESYCFCFNHNLTLHNNATIRYDAGTYPQRIYAQSADLTNTTTYIVLYLLSGDDGQYVSFKTQDQFSQTITGATITIEKQFSGVWTVIGEDLTDDSGTASFFLNPDDSHRITIAKESYSTYSSIIRPTQSSYTVVLSSSESATTDFMWEGIRYNTYPKSGIFLDPNTTYTFGFNVTSIIGNITSCKMTITNTSFDIIGSTVGCNSYGGNISLALGTGDNLRLFGNYYINLGSGYELMKSNNVWLVESVKIPDGGSLIFDLLTQLKDWDGFGAGNAAEFNRITFFFIMLIILLGIFTKTTGIEVSNAGYTMLILWGAITMFSYVGFFKIEGITRNVWMAKYFIWLMCSFMTWGYVINYWRVRTT